MRLKIWGYSQGDYLYSIAELGLTMNYKPYSIAKSKDIASQFAARWMRGITMRKKATIRDGILHLNGKKEN